MTPYNLSKQNQKINQIILYGVAKAKIPVQIFVRQASYVLHQPAVPYNFFLQELDRSFTATEHALFLDLFHAHCAPKDIHNLSQWTFNSRCVNNFTSNIEYCPIKEPSWWVGTRRLMFSG